MPVTPNLKLKLEDPEFKVTFSNIESSRSKCDTGITFSNKQAAREHPNDFLKRVEGIDLILQE